MRSGPFLVSILTNPFGVTATDMCLSPILSLIQLFDHSSESSASGIVDAAGLEYQLMFQDSNALRKIDSPFMRTGLAM